MTQTPPDIFNPKLPYGHDWLMSSEAAKPTLEVVMVIDVPIDNEVVIYKRTWMSGDKRRVIKDMCYNTHALSNEMKNLIREFKASQPEPVQADYSCRLDSLPDRMQSSISDKVN